MRRAFAVVCVAGLLAVGGYAQIDQQNDPLALYRASKKALLAPLLDVLQNAGVSGSLEFTGHCDPPLYDYAHYPDFPKLRAPVTNGGSTVQIVREMFFTDNPAIEVTQDKDGTIRMVELGVATDILNIWIGHIPFEGWGPHPSVGIFDPNAALEHVLATPEVQRFMTSQDVEQLGRAVSILVGKGGAPPPSGPHVTGSLDNVAFAQALNYILKSFPGIWWYQNCPATGKQARTVHFGFYHLERVGSENMVQ